MAFALGEKTIYTIAARLHLKLMRAFAVLLALAPLRLGMGAGTQLHQPLAIAFIGEFVVALLLLLLVLTTILKII
jgi:multidrug efflux pump subunit AcrB